MLPNWRNDIIDMCVYEIAVCGNNEIIDIHLCYLKKYYFELTESFIGQD